MRWLGLANRGLSARRPNACWLSFAVLTWCIVCCAPSIARADDDEPPRPTPRTAITIGGASVVLVAAKDKIYAFVDRLEDNSPVEDADLEVDTSDGSSLDLHRAPITLNKATSGLFVGPLNRVGRQQDAFMVTLRSSAGEGQAPAEITYTDVPNPTMVALPQTMKSKLAMIGVSSGIGAVAAIMFMLWLRGRRERVAPRSVGTAQAA